MLNIYIYGFAYLNKLGNRSIRCTTNAHNLRCQYKDKGWPEVQTLAFCFTGRPKKLADFVLYALTSSNIDRFSNFISLSESGEHL